MVPNLWSDRNIFIIQTFYWTNSPIEDDIAVSDRKAPFTGELLILYFGGGFSFVENICSEYMHLV